ncbi:MAG: glycosyltransferase family 2 protein [Tabrizicola sp.]|jgi:hypothetical protein|nr:glycosyltransferase family 2 protein [Tabrizicola sp.]
MDATEAGIDETALQSAAAVTMVKGDLFFLKLWIDHYGAQFGKENLYVVNHGRGADVAELAAGCNVIGIPEGSVEDFDRVRWRFLNNMVAGLNAYYRHVVVGDVDELLILDPASGKQLGDWLRTQPGGRVMTALGLEVLHHPDEETGDVASGVLGPRRYVRTSMFYSKPCVVSTPTRIARGGHFSSYPKLALPEDLYLLHLKYCDFDAYVDTLEARNKFADRSSISFRKTMIGRHWFSKFREDDAAVFRAFGALQLEAGFDMAGYRKRMAETFKPRGDSGYFQFDRTEDTKKYLLPDRFFGLV